MATTNYGWNTPTVGGSENTCGTQLNQNWTALDTLLNGVTQSEVSLLKGATSLVPSGVIMMWSGSVATIPTGFLLCDGTNGTPDLRSRFIVGAGSGYNPGDTGGADSVTLTTSQIPSHTHDFSASGSTSTDGQHGHNLVYADNDSGGGTNLYLAGETNAAGLRTSGYTSYTATASVVQNGNHSHTVNVSGTTTSTGGGSSHENRPPYYALAYIMKA